MEFNIPACPERFADIADAMGIEREESMSDEQYALKAVEYVKALNRKLNIPTIKETKESRKRDLRRSRKDLLTMFYQMTMPEKLRKKITWSC